MTTVLLVDDDSTLLKFLSEFLTNADFEVLSTDKSESALRLLYDERPDIIVLDVMMPGMDGFVLASRIREISSVPMILLTAKSSEADKLRGFRLGVDDYITKPFSFAELSARITAVLNRARGASPTPRNLFTFGNVTVDLDRLSVVRDGEAVSLSPTEFKMLRFLVENKGRAISEEELLKSVWGLELAPGSERGYVRRYVWFLRQKLERDPTDPEMIQTVRGFGYRMRES
ncbi:MAG: response regulator transcription factor [Chloroflexi bacterium]|nr:response regulator transcription factor [Chloroflexota bacterium]MBI5081922.1 response regulator transcription factor [Chloroflexota bacterium]